MSNCPRCGAPLDPDALRCFGCAQGVPRYLDVSQPRRDLSRNAAQGWFWGGAVAGAGVGGAGWAVLAVLEAIDVGQVAGGGFLDVGVLIGFVGVGAILGACAGLVWKALVRPVLLALFASEAFEREYGTPEEQGIIRKRKPGED